MNKKIFFVLVIIIFFWQKTFAQEEPRCNSVEYQQYLKATVPGYSDMMEQSEIYLQNYINSHKENRARTIITIPVVVHLLYHPDSLNHQLSDWQITSQIDALNEDYRRFNADKFNTPSLFNSIGADCEIEFCLAKKDPTGNTTNGIRRIATSFNFFNDFSSPKHTASGGDDAWPNSSYLNIWVCPLEYPMLGYATFPVNIDSNDGVVIHYKAFGRINCFSPKYFEGRTATHEVGHWLNLVHIWGDSPGCSPDDNVDDTPVQDKEHYKCDGFPFPSCNNTSDMFMNYMDYTLDSCMNIFTIGQRNAMTDAINAFRSGLLTSDGCVPLASTFAWDIGVSKILHPDEFIYGETMKPVVTIHNYGIQTITTADIFYTKNWGSEIHVFNWTGSLPSNENIDITLPEIADSSWYNLFCAWTKHPNGFQDADTTNDFKTRSYIVSFTYPDPTEILKIYPNPNGGIVTVDFGEIIDLKGTITVFNVLGQQQKIQMDQLSLSKFQIDLSHFPSGMYFLDFRVNGKKIIKKVAVQHER